MTPFLQKLSKEHYSNFCTFEIASFDNALGHYLRKHSIHNMGDIWKILDSKWLLFHNSFSTFFQSLDGKIFASIEVASKYHFSEMTSAEDGTKLEVIQTH